MRALHHLALGCALVGILGTSEAAAYCRTTTCDPEDEVCDLDGNGCITEGSPLWWRSGRLAMWADEVGAPKAGITGTQTAGALAVALDAWSAAICSDGSLPSIEAFVAGELDSAEVGFNLKDLPSNKNVVLYEEEAWPSSGRNIVALTSTTFDTRSGQILDADTELNGVHHAFSLSAAGEEVDLLAVLTHEMGHALGLDHTNVADATMQPETPGFAFEELRTLEADDMEGICAIYPARADDGCACATPADAKAAPTGQGWWLLVAGLLLLGRRAVTRPFAREADTLRSSRPFPSTTWKGSPD